MLVVNANIASPSHYKKHARECIQEMVILFGWEAVASVSAMLGSTGSVPHIKAIKLKMMGRQTGTSSA